MTEPKTYRCLIMLDTQYGSRQIGASNAHIRPFYNPKAVISMKEQPTGVVMILDMVSCFHVMPADYWEIHYRRREGV